MNWLVFGVCDLISKVTEVKYVRYMVSGSRVIFMTDKDINFKFGIGILPGKLCECESIKFGAIIVNR